MFINNHCLADHYAANKFLYIFSLSLQQNSNILWYIL